MPLKLLALADAILAETTLIHPADALTRMDLAHELDEAANAALNSSDRGDIPPTDWADLLDNVTQTCRDVLLPTMGAVLLQAEEKFRGEFGEGVMPAIAIQPQEVFEANYLRPAEDAVSRLRKMMNIASAQTAGAKSLSDQQFREGGKPDGRPLTPSYLKESDKWLIDGPTLSKAHKAKKLTDRRKLAGGREYAYLYRELLALRDEKTDQIE